MEVMYWKIKREHTEEMIKVGELNKSLQRMEISGISSGAQETQRAKQGLSVLLIDMLYSVLVEFRCVCSRILRVQVWVVIVYNPTEGDVEEREKFWNDFEMVVGRV